MDINIITVLVCLVASLFAGLGTGFVGMSAAVAITPILMGFLGIPHFEATAIALASDVLASGGAAFMYNRHKNVDIKNGIILLITIIIFTFGGTVVAYYIPSNTMGIGTIIGVSLMGLKLIIFPAKTNPKRKENLTPRRKLIYSVLFGAIIGFICGFVGAGGGMLLLLALTVFLGYEMHMAVGTSVFVMAFAAFTGAGFHILYQGVINPKPGSDITTIPFTVMILCVVLTLAFSIIGSKLANAMKEKTLSRVSGAMLVSIAVTVAIVMLVK